MDRTPERVVAAMAAANSEGSKAKPPEGPRFPPKLMARVPEAERAAATDPIGAVRCRVWLRALAAGEWPTEDLVTLFRADADPVLRLRVLDRLSGRSLDEPAVDAVAEAVAGDHDYVRCAAARALSKAGGKRAVRVLRDTIAKALGGATGWKNPNNVLCDVVEASIATPDTELVDVLGSVLTRHGANNYATLLATRSLVAIGRKVGADLVRPHLERAARLEGGQAAQIRREVAAFLDGK